VNWLTVHGARQHNLKDIDVAIPLGRFVCVTGVSGSGKSSLVIDIIRERLARDLNGAEKAEPGKHDRIVGVQHLDKVIDIDQSPIGRTPRSNPATYIKLFDLIRDLFSRLPDSRVRGYKPGRFSFNVQTGEPGGGRCEACEGNGANRIEMDFLADVWVPCPVCGGRRFNHETLQIHYRGKSIADVLDMDVQEAMERFAAIPKVHAMLKTLHDVGLDYLKLGQSSTTLSGGEAQRIKLARELVKRSTGRTLYILDEPTTGLHFEDIRRLLAVLHGFVDSANSVVVIEHNLDVIKTADWVIDLGPEGGDQGGRVVVAGTPEEVADCPASYTGQALRDVLHPRRTAKEFSALAGGCSHQRTARSLATPPPDQGRGLLGRGLSAKAQGLSTDSLVVIGAREHNLKDVTVSLPRGKMTICSGVSGSGKTSFAIDTVFTEGQRRYVESLSTYARQFLGQMQKPKVDHVHGLSPAIAIEQKAASQSPRSTVGTVTEIHDYMRVLWARVGRPYCPRCQQPIGTQTSDEIVDKIMALPAGTRLTLCAPIERGPGETWESLLARCAAQGYIRARIDGAVNEIKPDLRVDTRRRHAVELVVDRIVVKPAGRGRVADSIEHCLALGQGVMLAVPAEEDAAADPNHVGRARLLPSRERSRSVMRFSQHLACETCGKSYDELTPHHFSFNSRLGWCPSCEGLGVQRGTQADTVIVSPRESILTGAIAGWTDLANRPLLRAFIIALAKAIGVDPNAPCSLLTDEQRHSLLFGLGDRWIAVEPIAAGLTPGARGAATPNPQSAIATSGLRFQWKGFFPAIDEATKISWQHRGRLEETVADVPCQTCGGGRIQPQAKAVRLGGKSIVEASDMSLAAAAAFFKNLHLDRRQAKIAAELLHEIKSRLRFLIDVGLGYLSLGRSAPTLSGGESQRIRLASQIGSGLTGVLYVLDEPTIGLHPRDNKRLIGALQRLRDLGNTLLLVEHDREVIEAGDHLLDFGPGAGALGGRVVAAASPSAVKRNGESLTGRYLSGKAAIPVPTNRRSIAGLAQPGELARGDERTPTLTVVGARQNNLRSIDAAFPLGRFTCVTGVSGSGKSSLVTEILSPALAARLHRARLSIGAHDSIRGIEHVDKIINVDQQPIGNSPLSNAATYTGVFDLVREVFARLPESKVRGYTANRFSFARPGGSCDDCNGFGQVCYEMHFLPDVWVPCDTCHGARYNRETLEVRYKGKSITDVLEMSAGEALEHFANIPKVRRLLQTLVDVGLGYLPLGQSAPTLSGGEAQRVKLAAELGRPNTGKTVYILDEPTTGLHFDDLRKLLDVLHRLVDLGNTVICIEHNLDVIKTADWIIDLGPEAGDQGGAIVIAGTPETVASEPASHTGRALTKTLADGPHIAREVFDPAKAAAASTTPAFDGTPAGAGSEPAAKMPWQVNGRRWHTELRTSRDGKAVEWEGRALIHVVEQIEHLGGDKLLPPDWNDRARVEIAAKAPGDLAQSAMPWFCHALTGGRWLLDLNFRIPEGTFTQRDLAAKLALKTLDERDDIQAYGQTSRVQVRTALGAMDQVRVMVHDRKEIDTPAFRSFLAAAVKAYLAHVASLAADAEQAEPWKTDGKAWHLSQKSVSPGQQKRWKPMTLTAFLGLVNRAAPTVKALWDRKVFVELVTPDDRRVGKVITNHGDALRVDLHVPRGRFTPTQVEHLGGRQEFARPGSSGAELTFWFQSLDEVHTEELRSVLQAAAEPGEQRTESPGLQSGRPLSSDWRSPPASDRPD
jgi:excinuclease ABC subunit A